MEDSIKKGIDFLYGYYESDHSMRVGLSLRPSEPWNEIPEKLLTKEEFIETLKVDTKMEFALNVLICYISKQK